MASIFFLCLFSLDVEFSQAAKAAGAKCNCWITRRCLFLLWSLSVYTLHLSSSKGVGHESAFLCVVRCGGHTLFPFLSSSWLVTIGSSTEMY